MTPSVPRLRQRTRRVEGCDADVRSAWTVIGFGRARDPIWRGSWSGSALEPRPGDVADGSPTVAMALNDAFSP
jgi:hypothetical protein